MKDHATALPCYKCCGHSQEAKSQCKDKMLRKVA